MNNTKKNYTKFIVKAHLLSSFLFGSIIAGPLSDVLALPKPMTSEELINNSNLIAVITVLNTTQAIEIDQINEKYQKFIKEYNFKENISKNIQDDIINNIKNDDIKDNLDLKNNINTNLKMNYATAVINKIIPKYTIKDSKITNINKYESNLKSGDTILLCWKNLNKGSVGGWSVSFEKDEISYTYLIWNDNKKCYTATYWHGKEILNPEIKS
ncbi:hypothetical protein [Lyticum sinuosum]|uniref:Uncharacterized protein n=1 Tax=Lyticum sinuosum TaxID=1332059 RepID=A0AAE5AH04_9RICK|nr:hypothetical protein [Lyticum sinuosum]MDZ5761417.1 hypothetical protein [Lyticum sinuosum]